MDSIRELADDIYRERVLRARRMPPESKLFAGAELFEGVCRRMMDGIRHERPDLNEEQVRQALRERLALLRRLEERP